MAAREGSDHRSARRPLVAIDGPGGAGKSTVSKALATRLGVPRLDTGAMYRAVTLLALRGGVDVSDRAATAAIAHAVDLELDGDRVFADGDDVTAAIRTREVDGAVSAVAANPDVRTELVRRQQAWIAVHDGAVVEGRDIGTVVAPQAAVKVYLTASPEARAARRAAQHEVQAATAEEAMRRRDRLDSSREASPLAKAPDATEIDSTRRSVEEVVEEVLRLLELTTTGTGGAVAGRPIRPGELRFYEACRIVAVGISRLAYPGPVVGAERIPASGAYILAPVHRSNLDWLIVARLTRRRLRYLVKDGVWRVRLIGRLIELLGAFPVHRRAADREALNTALSVLAGGEPLVLFPEGTRCAGPVVESVHDGAAYLALRADVPIVPVGVAGTEKAMPRGRVLPRPGRVALVVGDPILPRDVLRGREQDGGAASHGAERARETRHVPRGAVRAMTAALVSAMQACFDEAGELLARHRIGSRTPAVASGGPSPEAEARLPSPAASGSVGAGASEEVAETAAGVASLERGGQTS